MRPLISVKIIVIAIILLALAGGCKVRKKDCRGKRKTVKTEMGGWM